MKDKLNFKGENGCKHSQGLIWFKGMPFRM